jgi:hypothetical protein
MSAKTVWENVALPLKVSNYDKADIEQRVNEVLTLVGLADKAKYYPLNFWWTKATCWYCTCTWFTSLKFYSVMKQPQHLILKVPPLFCLY